MKIGQIICIDRIILMVFHTPERCWQVSCIDENVQAKVLNQVFYTFDAAEEGGRDWIRYASID